MAGNSFRQQVYLHGGRGGAKMAPNGSPGLGEGLVSSRRVSLLVGNDPLGTIPIGCAMTRLWSSPLSSKLPIRALRMMSSRPRLLAGSAKEGPLVLTEPGHGEEKPWIRGGVGRGGEGGGEARTRRPCFSASRVWGVVIF